MKKYYPFVVIPFLIILLTLFVLYNRYSGYYEEEQIDGYITKNINILNENLEFEKRYAQSLSLFISKDQVIKNALKSNDQKIALQGLHIFLAELKETTGIDNVDIQVHTKDLKAFARSWDNGDYFGVDLSGFRKGLVKVKKTLRPYVSIELGKRLNIKAISPIFDEQHRFIGSIEAIVGFQNMKKRLHKLGLDTIGLLDQKYINIAVDLKDHNKIGRYYTLEKSFPYNLFGILSNNREILEGKKYYYKVGNKLVVLVPMKSVGIQDVGIIALSMPVDGDVSRGYRYRNLSQENSKYVYNNNSREVTIK